MVYSPDSYVPAKRRTFDHTDDRINIRRFQPAILEGTTPGELLHGTYKQLSLGGKVHFLTLLTEIIVNYWSKEVAHITCHQTTYAALPMKLIDTLRNRDVHEGNILLEIQAFLEQFKRLLPALKDRFPKRRSKYLFQLFPCLIEACECMVGVLSGRQSSKEILALLNRCHIALTSKGNITPKFAESYAMLWGLFISKFPIATPNRSIE